jgi:hypothetical protein
MSTTPPPTTPAGAPPPPAQTAAPEAVTLEGVVDVLRPMFGTQVPNINTWETRCLVERLLNEKASRGPLQEADATAKALLGRAIGGWDNPSVKSGALLRAACVILNVSPVPAVTQPPAAQPAAAPTWGDFPAALPVVAETVTTVTTNPDKAARRAAKRARKAIKRARQRALLIGVIAGVAGVAGVIAGATGGWAALAAALIAGVAGVAGIVTGIKVYGVGHSRRQPRR